jgi:hypothetical protein
MLPRPELASTTYCLANPGVEYLVYLPIDPYGIASWMASARVLWRVEPLVSKFSLWFRGWLRQTVTVDLSTATGDLAVEWFNPSTHTAVVGGKTPGGARRSFTAPFRGDAVLYIRSSEV